jgi:hypothetical protein
MNSAQRRECLSPSALRGLDNHYNLSSRLAAVNGFPLAKGPYYILVLLHINTCILQNKPYSQVFKIWTKSDGPWAKLWRRGKKFAKIRIYCRRFISVSLDSFSFSEKVSPEGFATVYAQVKSLQTIQSPSRRQQQKRLAFFPLFSPSGIEK